MEGQQNVYYYLSEVLRSSQVNTNKNKITIIIPNLLPHIFRKRILLLTLAFAVASICGYYLFTFVYDTSYRSILKTSMHYHCILLALWRLDWITTIKFPKPYLKYSHCTVPQ